MIHYTALKSCKNSGSSARTISGVNSLEFLSTVRCYIFNEVDKQTDKQRNRTIYRSTYQMKFSSPQHLHQKTIDSRCLGKERMSES